MIKIIEFKIGDTDFYVKNGTVIVYDVYGEEIELCSINEFIKVATELQNALDFIEMNEGEIRLGEINGYKP